MSVARLAFASALCLTAVSSAAVPFAAAQDCAVVSGVCCAARPVYSDPNYGFTADVVVGTREVEPGTGACVTIFDITPPYPGDGTDFATVQRYHGPGDSWNSTNLGSVFGLTLDPYGNIFVTETSCYNIDFPGPGGAGAIYRIANATGAINTFANLPNSFGVGLGNISYDCDHDQFFVTNHEDGKIYRLKTASTNAPTASIQESFDPMLPDDGSVGFAPLGERLWGVQWHAGRVYYAVWSENCNETAGPANTIRSVALDGSGAFVPSSDQLEIVLPPHVNGYSHPVSDISFTRKGSMLLADRSMSGASFAAAHESRMLEYECGAASGSGGWVPSANTYVLGVSAVCCCSGIAGNGTNSAGGVDSDFTPYAAATPFGRYWGTSDAMNNTLTVYGIQGLPPSGGTPAVSAWIDFDGTVAGTEKTNLGDVEVPCPDVATATTLTFFTAEPAADALRLRWQFSEPEAITSLSLERAGAAEGPWTAVDAEPTLRADAMELLDRDVVAGESYYYRLQVQLGREALTFGPIRGTMVEAITGFALSLRTPNPSDGPVRLEFALPRAAAVRVSVVDVAGREVQELADGAYAPGRYPITWDATAGGGVRSGVFFVRYVTPDGSFTQRVVLRP